MSFFQMSSAVGFDDITTPQHSSAALLAEKKKTQIFASFATTGNIARLKIVP